jgi:hypothetical protein
MSLEIFFENKKYISVKTASSLTGYSKDYIGQLCRQDKIIHHRVGRVWYVEEQSITDYKNTPSTFDFSKNLSHQDNLESHAEHAEASAPGAEKNVTRASSRSSEISDILSRVRSFSVSARFKSRQNREKISRIHARMFASRFSPLATIMPLAIGLVFAIGLVSAEEQIGSAAAKAPQAVRSVSAKAVSLLPSPIAISDAIVFAPHAAYQASDDMLSLYAGTLTRGYLSSASALRSAASTIASQASIAAHNPPLYVSSIFRSAAVAESHGLDAGLSATSQAIAAVHQKTFAFISDSFGGTPYARIAARDAVANVAGTITRMPPGPIDVAGVAIYDAFNSFFARTIYMPIASLLGSKPPIAEFTTRVSLPPAKPIATTVTPKVKMVATPAGSGLPASLPAQPIVIRQVTEQVTYAGVTEQTLDARLQEFNNKIQSQLSSLSTGTGGSITNVYQQIAQSNRIDQLTGTALNSPAITGGTITGTTISSPSISVTNLAVGSASFSGTASIAGNFGVTGTTTLTNLLVTGTTTLQSATSTSLYANLFHASTGIIDTFASTLATISGLNVTNSTTTNATTTNFAATGLASLATTTIAGNLAVNTSQFFINTSSGTAGFGTTTPWGQLSVNPNALGSTVPEFVIGSSTSTHFIVTNSGNVGIGTTSPGLALSVAGNAYVSGNLTVGNNVQISGGSIVLGNSTSTSITVNSSFNSDLVPSVNKTYNIGSASYFWNRGYIDTLTVNNLGAASTTISGTASPDFTIGSSNATADLQDMNLIFFRGVVVPNAVLSWSHTAHHFDLNQPLHIQNLSANDIPSFIAQSYSGQTSDIFQALNSAGTNLFSVTAGGKVGLGSTTPWAQLSVNPSGIGNAPEFAIGSSTKTDFVVTNSGNVGIGLNNPISPLEVNGIVRTGYVNTAAHSSANGTDITLNSAGSNYGTIQSEAISGAGTWSLGYQNSASNSLGTSVLTWNGSGNVGIGTTGPATRLSVSAGNVNSSAYDINIDGTKSVGNYTGLSFGDSGGGTVFAGIKYLADAANDSSLRFLTYSGAAGGTERMVIKGATGNVGIGVTSPAAKLDVMGGSGVGGEVARFGGKVSIGISGSEVGTLNILSSTGRQFAFSEDNTNDSVISNTSGKITITPTTNFIVSQGNTGIGTTTPPSLLTVGPTSAQLVSANPVFLLGTSTLMSPSANGTYIGLNAPTGFTGDFLNLQSAAANTSVFKVSNSNATNVVTVVGTAGGAGATADVLKLIKQTGGTPAAGIGSAILFNTQNSSFSNVDAARVSGFLPDVTPGAEKGALVFQTKPSGSATLSERMRIDDAGNVGIGTTSPSQLLSVSSSGGNSAYFAGNVGVGTNAPGYSLDLFSLSGLPFRAAASSAMLFNATNNAITFTNASQTTTATGQNVSNYFNNFNNNAGLLLRKTSTGTGDYLAIEDSSNNGILYVKRGGNVGIGTTTPQTSLDIQTASVAGVSLRATGANSQATYDLYGAYDQASPVRLQASAISNPAAGSFLGGFLGTVTNHKLNLGTNNTVKLTIDTSGNVGIGTTNPTKSLTVNGAMNFIGSGSTVRGIVGSPTWDTSYFAIQNGSIAESAANAALVQDSQGVTTIGAATGKNINFSINQGIKMTLDSTGNVGIGTTSPQTIFHVYGASAPTVRIQDSASSVAYLEVAQNNSQGRGQIFSTQSDLAIGTANTNFALTMFTQGNERARITGAGNFGIGSTTPWAQLSVNPNGIGSGPEFAIGSSSATHFVVTTAGNVGIGTTTPWAQLSVNPSGIGNGPAFAVGSSTTTNFVVTNAGTVGIGTTNPTAKLDVVGSGATAILDSGAAATSNSLAFYDNGSAKWQINKTTSNNLSVLNSGNSGETVWTMYGGTSDDVIVGNGADGGYRLDVSQAGTNGAFRVVTGTSTFGGNVGIGTSTPADLLHVSGTTPNIRIASTNGNNAGLTLYNGTTERAAFLDQNTNIYLGAITNTPVFLGSNNSAQAAVFSGAASGSMSIGTTTAQSQTTLTVQGNNTNSAWYALRIQDSSVNTLFAVRNDGNVGIGTTTPASILSIVSSHASDSLNLLASADFAIKFNNAVGTTRGALDYNLNSNELLSLFTYQSGTDIALSPYGATNALYVKNTSGNVGVGTTTPWGKLSINNSTSDTAGQPLFVIASSTASATTTSFIVTNAGNVGIGTANPTGRLDVVQSSEASAGGGLQIESTGFNTVGMALQNGNTGGRTWDIFSTAGGSGGGQGRLAFFDSTAASYRMVIDPSGFVGVASTTPWAQLSVNPNGIGNGPAFAVGSSTATNFVVTNAGNVLINNTTGTYPLSLNGNERINGRLDISSGGISASNFARITHTDATNNLDFTTAGSGTGNNITFNPSGNVGIGTTGPAFKLDVSGTGQVANFGDGTNVNTTIGVAGTRSAFGYDGVGAFFQGSAGKAVSLKSNASYLAVVGSGTGIGTGIGGVITDTNTLSGSALVALSTGNVGIGTTSPAQKLDVAGNILLGDNQSDPSFLYFGGTTNAFPAIRKIGATLGVVKADASDWANFTAGNVTSVYKLSSSQSLAIGATYSSLTPPTNGAIFEGNVGIGTTSPWAKLSINNSTGDTAGQPLFVIASSTASATTTSFIVTNTGNVGIGSTSPTAAFVLGSGQALFPDGSSVAPSISFGNQTGTGFYYIGSNNVGFTRGGSNSLTIRAVSGGGAIVDAQAGSGTGGFSINNDTFLSRISAGVWQAGTAAGNALGTVVAGSIGIGTTSPRSNLEVYAGTSGANGMILSQNAVTSGRLFFVASNGVGPAIYANNGNLTFTTQGTPGVGSGTSQMTIDNNTGNVGIAQNLIVSGTGNTTIAGNVGIGTTSPNTLLNIGGSLTTTAAAGLNFGGDVSSNLYRSAAGTIKTDGTFVAAGNITTTGSADIISTRNINIQGNTVGMYVNALVAGNTSQFGFSSTAAFTGSLDAGFSRVAAGKIGVGNGTVGDVSGTLVAGNIGIGTTTTGALLQVGNNTTAASGGIQLGTDVNLYRSGAGQFTMTGNPAADGAVFGQVTNNFASTNGQTAPVLWMAAPNMGVGSSAELNVGKSTGLNNRANWDFYYAGNNSTSNRMDFGFYGNNGLLSILGSGNVGIGTTSPVALLSLNGGTTAALGLNFGDATANLYRNAAGSIKTDGSLTVGGSGISTGAINLGTSKIVLDGTGLAQNSSSVIRWSSTGWYYDTADTGLSRGAAGKLYVGNGTAGDYTGTLIAGNVGIGTTSPTQQLSVGNGGIAINRDGGGATEPFLLFQGNGSQLSQIRGVNGGGIRFTNSGNAESMRIDNSGNVGIGTTTPVAKLNVGGSGNLLRIGDGSGDVSMTMVNGAGVGTVFNSQNISGLPMLTFGDNTNVSIHGTGVGIGTGGNNASGNGLLLAVNGKTSFGNTYAAYLHTPDAGVKINYPTASWTQLIVQGAVSQTGNLQEWWNSAGTALTAIDKNGNIGIGTTTPSAKLALKGGGTTTGRIFTLSDSADAEKVTVLDSGKFGIGTTSPWTSFAVQGNVSFSGLSAGAGAGSLCLSANNEVTYSAGATCTVSSQRFKHDIVSATEGLDFVNRLRPVTFQYNADIGVPGEQFGFIAEEVESLDPRLVVHDAQGLPFSVRYENMTAVLAKAIQDLDLNVETVAGRAASSTPQSQAFADSFFHNIFAKMAVWLADAANGLGGVVADAFHAKSEICVDDQCLNKDDVRRLLAMAHGSGEATSTSAGGSTASSTPADTSAPVISVVGANPATIIYGTTYSDMGATVTDTNADGTVNNNLGLHFSVDGKDLPEVIVDTSMPADQTQATTTHTIVYSAVDGAGNWGYATRTVEVSR